MNEQEKAAACAAWLADPRDLHYRGELIELGVRVTDAIEHEIVRSQEIREEQQ